MTQYALEHPYITALLVISVLIVIDNTIKSIEAVRIARHNSRGGVKDEHQNL